MERSRVQHAAAPFHTEDLLSVVIQQEDFNTLHGGKPPIIGDEQRGASLYPCGDLKCIRYVNVVLSP